MLSLQLGQVSSKVDGNRGHKPTAITSSWHLGAEIESDPRRDKAEKYIRRTQIYCCGGEKICGHWPKWEGMHSGTRNSIL